MKTRLAVCITVIILSCSTARSATLTFDEFPSGTVLSDSSYSRVSFSSDFQVTDHVGSLWGPPHSGSNVLTSTAMGWSSPLIAFGDPMSHLDPVESVRAYFSTQADAMVGLVAYRPGFQEVARVVIGGPGESWNNRLVEIRTTGGLPFSMIALGGVSSPDDFLGFCLDDMTINLIPEPSSLLALGAGLGALGLAIRRRTSNIERRASPAFCGIPSVGGRTSNRRTIRPLTMDPWPSDYRTGGGRGDYDFEGAAATMGQGANWDFALANVVGDS